MRPRTSLAAIACVSLSVSVAVAVLVRVTSTRAAALDLTQVPAPSVARDVTVSPGTTRLALAGEQRGLWLENPDGSGRVTLDTGPYIEVIGFSAGSSHFAWIGDGNLGVVKGDGSGKVLIRGGRGKTPRAAYAVMEPNGSLLVVLNRQQNVGGIPSVQSALYRLAPGAHTLREVRLTGAYRPTRWQARDVANSAVLSTQVATPAPTAQGLGVCEQMTPNINSTPTRWALGRVSPEGTLSYRTTAGAYIDNGGCGATVNASVVVKVVATTGGQELLLVNRGGRLSQLSLGSHPRGQEGDVFETSLSPNGRYCLVYSPTNPEDGRLVNLATGRFHRLNAVGPGYWTPDSSKVAAATGSPQATSSTIVIMTAASGTKVPVGTLGRAILLGFTADGSRFLWLAANPLGQNIGSGLWSAAANGRARQQLVPVEQDVQNVVTDPAGTHAFIVQGPGYPRDAFKLWAMSPADFTAPIGFP